MRPGTRLAVVTFSARLGLARGRQMRRLASIGSLVVFSLNPAAAHASDGDAGPVAAPLPPTTRPAASPAPIAAPPLPSAIPPEAKSAPQAAPLV